jgi:alkylhydroperoxidase family enzyme
MSIRATIRAIARKEGIKMAWVRSVGGDAATGELHDVYQRVRARAGFIANIARVQSLRPKTTALGFDLYCQIMDDPTGISKRERVLIATVVSKINGCHY